VNAIRASLLKPSGQVLLATLFFCFIFVVLFAGLYQAGITYIAKERSRRASDLTVLSAGAIYANGLQWVRYTNIVDMGLTALDIGVILERIGPMLAGLPEDLPQVISAAEAADPKTREKIGQRLQKYLFGIDLGGTSMKVGAYPELLHLLTHETAQANRLSDDLLLPYHLYNFETGTPSDIPIPNMALRFRTAAELVPNEGKGPYSLMHDGVRVYFSSAQVEPARNPLFPRQMRVKKHSDSSFAGWWVRKEKDVSDPGREMGPLAMFGGARVMNELKDFLRKFRFDVTDRDDPPCHTYTTLAQYPVTLGGRPRIFYQVSEVRVEAEGLAAWDVAHPITTRLQKAELGAFPVLKKIPLLDSMLDRFGSLL
jgi:hypothetical protein